MYDVLPNNAVDWCVQGYIQMYSLHTHTHIYLTSPLGGPPSKRNRSGSEWTECTRALCVLQTNVNVNAKMLRAVSGLPRDWAGMEKYDGVNYQAELRVITYRQSCNF